jgi:hypothetical protein
MSLAVSSHSILTDAQDVGSFPVSSECTISQAANFLRTSEGYVTELLDDGLIEYRQKEGQRFVQWNSLADFEQERERRYKGLERIFQQFREMGLNDD